MEKTRSLQAIDIKHLVNKLIKHWLLIFISLFICIAISITYLKIASKTFAVGTKILIEVDERRRESSASEYFDVGDLMNKNRSLQNELISLQSTPLIREVVDEMNLVTTYFMQEGRIPIPSDFVFTLTDLYKASPFIVVIDEKHPQPINSIIYVGIRDDETYTISAIKDFSTIYSFEDGRVVHSAAPFNLYGVYRFGETVENEYCSFRIILNANYNPEQFDGKQLFFKLNSQAQLAEQFRGSLSVRSRDMESSMVDLSFQWSNATLASDFLNNLVAKYIEKNLEDKNRLANSTIDFINNQLSNISSSLGRSEQQLQNFRSRYDVMSIDEKTRTLSAQIMDLESNRDDIESNYRALIQVKDYFEINKDSPNFIAPSLLGVEDEVLSSLMQEMSRLVSERQELINKNQLKNPRLKTLEQNIGNIQGVISDNIELLISKKEAEIEEITNRMGALDREYSRLPQTQRRLTGLEREFSITDAAYTALLNKRIEAQITMASNESDVEIIEPVKFFGVIAPNPMKTLALAIIIALFFPLTYVVLKVLFTDKVETTDEIAGFVGLKQAGIIPHSETKSSNVIVNAPNTPMSESFFTLKSNIVYYLMGEINKCILVTSSIPNEGKSFTALNLASSFAATHNKTALVSFDMRRYSSVFRELKSDLEIGLSNYLINHSEYKDIIVQTDIPNLYYIDNGEVPPDPVALISSPKTKEFFERLKKEFDYVVIDSPPYDVFTDAFLLMANADIKLFVSRVGEVTRKALRNCIYDFNVKKIENIYSVLNDVKNIKDSKYSYYRDRNKKKGIFGFLRRRK